MLTSKGYYKFNDTTALDPAKLRSVCRATRSAMRCITDADAPPSLLLLCVLWLQIGFAIADQKEGDFELRVQWIKAVAQLEKPGKRRDDDDDDDDMYVNLLCSASTVSADVCVPIHLRATATTWHPPSRASRSRGTWSSSESVASHRESPPPISRRTNHSDAGSLRSLQRRVLSLCS